MGHSVSAIYEFPSCVRFLANFLLKLQPEQLLRCTIRCYLLQRWKQIHLPPRPTQEGRERDHAELAVQRYQLRICGAAELGVCSV